VVVLNTVLSAAALAREMQAGMPVGAAQAQQLKHNTHANNYAYRS
jgi:hypothetical protein